MLMILLVSPLILTACVLALVQLLALRRERRHADLALAAFWSGRAAAEVIPDLERLPASITRDMALATLRELERSQRDGVAGAAERISSATEAIIGRGRVALTRWHALLMPLGLLALNAGVAAAIAAASYELPVAVASLLLIGGLGCSLLAITLDAVLRALARPLLAELDALSHELHAVADRSSRSGPEPRMRAVA